MHEAVKSFELDVRAAVRRGSKSNEFEDSIKEVVGHYSDLFQDQLDQSETLEVVDQNARKRIGSLGQIAIQILNCASQKAKGLKRQQMLFWVPALAPLLFIGAQWQGNLAVSHFFWAMDKPLIMIFIVCGLAFGQGVFMAKKLTWKPLIAAYFLASILLFPIYYSGSYGDKTIDGMTKPQVGELLAKYSKLEQDTKAINQIIGKSKKPFEVKHTIAVGMIEKSNTGQFAIDPTAVGAYLKPISIKPITDKAIPVQIQLGRTNSASEAQVAWNIVGQEFINATEGSLSRQRDYRFFFNYQPWPLWYIVYGSFMVPGVFLGIFAALAGIAHLWSRIWILRGDWLKLQRG